MRITEIFFSIQGESSYAGLPCVFVRFTGCPLRCGWCDTAYAFYEGTERSLESILNEVAHYDCRLVEITGGEPLAQAEAHGLITALADRGYTVLIETSGAIDLAPVDPRAILIMDLKCPGSSMEDRNRWSNLSLLKPHDEVKFVIKDRADYEWAVEIIHRYGLSDRQRVLLSPVFGELEPQVLADWILADRLPVRFQLQVHKLIWDPAMRGV
ncbi:MAG: 7-carboxy-7-deazaguanine synthase QueE [Nitrospirota bacterium]